MRPRLTSMQFSRKSRKNNFKEISSPSISIFLEKSIRTVRGLIAIRYFALEEPRIEISKKIGVTKNNILSSN